METIVRTMMEETEAELIRQGRSKVIDISTNGEPTSPASASPLVNGKADGFTLGDMPFDRLSSFVRIAAARASIETERKSLLLRRVEIVNELEAINNFLDATVPKEHQDRPPLLILGPDDRKPIEPKNLYVPCGILQTLLQAGRPISTAEIRLRTVALGIPDTAPLQDGIELLRKASLVHFNHTTGLYSAVNQDAAFVR